jgi:hypothetical protein
MAYNIALEHRIDKLTTGLGTVSKKKMFGGVGYLMSGNLVFGVHKQALIIRTSAESAESLLKKEFVGVFDITGRPMKGWLLVSPDGLKTEKQLGEFLQIAVDYVKTLPRK